MKKLNAYNVYLILSFARLLCFYTIFTVNLVYQAQVAGLTPLQLVLVGTTLEITIFLCEVPTGVVADVYSRRLSVIIGTFVVGLGFLIEGTFPSFAAILLSQVLWGVGYTFTSGATDAWIADEIGEQQAGRAYLRGAQIGNFGALIGTIISTILSTVALNFPVQIGALGLIGLAGFLALFMPETGFKPAPMENRNTWQKMWGTFGQGVKIVRGQTALILILGLGLFFGLHSEGFDRLWRELLRENFTFPALGSLDPVVWFGILYGASTLVSIVLTEIAQRRMTMENPRMIAWVSLGLSAVIVAALLVFALAGNFALAVAMFLIIYPARELLMPLYTTWVNQRIDSSVRATVLSMSSFVDAIGQTLGGPPVGLIGNMFGVRAAIFVSGLLLSPVLILYGMAARRSELRVVEEIAS